MRVIFTGASSFTGAWMARALVDAGHEVSATYRGQSGSYDGTRAQRVSMLEGVAEQIWNTEFGGDRFIGLLRSGSFDLLCHHAAEMTGYRDWDFDPLAATASNTRNIRTVLDVFAQRGGTRIVHTGTVFEPYEGIGDVLERAFNPYGLSKHLSFEVCRLEAERLGLDADKFVIPNPFGPLEEARFTSYLFRQWRAGHTPSVRTPAYIRDNIHVSLLARAYVDFVTNRPRTSGVAKVAPSGYVESQGDFARRVAGAVARRTGLKTPVDTPEQTVFDEPFIRVNPVVDAPWREGWDEDAAWDAACAYWQTLSDESVRSSV